MIEDDDNKRANLIAFVGEVRPHYEVAVARSYNSGLLSIIRGQPNLVLLDMSMPTFDISPDEDGGSHQPYAGWEILRQIDARGVGALCVVVTQFDRFGEGKDAMTAKQLHDLLRAEHPDAYGGMVSYETSAANWKDALLEILRGTEEGGRS